MEMATYLVTAVLVEGQSVRKVARDHGVSKTWVYELVARYQAEGEAGLVPRSSRPHRSPTKIADLFEDEIVRIRKELTEAGYDAGPETIQVHLRRAHRRAKVPSTSTIWRVLKARGFVTPEPHKRPRSRRCASSPTCPMNAGKWTSPTCISPAGERSRSSTSSTTTPACVSLTSPAHLQGHRRRHRLPRSRSSLGVSGQRALGQRRDLHRGGPPRGLRHGVRTPRAQEHALPHGGRPAARQKGGIDPGGQP